ncbi:MAG: glycine/sarcosine/betaine reductase complex component C subunit beta [Defluviitaleaceae bacterium]|nr:glycine/sarcosine/betaine reductase complex component C subunit beta [Defluviitaleaceae bacterium]
MNSVIKSVAYTLVHAPDLVIHAGTTQTTERIVNPESEYLKQLPDALRTFEQAVNYAPNQAYIGGMTPEGLAEIPMPWYENAVKASRFGKFGEIAPQEELYLMMQICDCFDLVMLEAGFVSGVVKASEDHPLFTMSIVSRIKAGVEFGAIEAEVTNNGAEGLYHGGKLVGCVKKAHSIDENLSAHVILENLVSKATSVLSLLHLTKNAGIDPASIDCVIDCSEEAVGDMNQRGGGNLAKASAEIAGFIGATGNDMRAFCAAPVHAIISAAALVKSGTYKNVVVTAGGSTAKLGMNAKDHVKKGLPVLEDVLGGFAVLISENDGINPEILSEYVGWHSVGSGSSPQAVITALVTDPLDKLGLKITDVDKFSPEMQNPDVTKPAGAGDVPEANFKMIGALAVKRGEMDRADLAGFVEKHGMMGFAPTQGHIPSGIPYLGHGREDMLAEKITRAMFVGKGSLFLGRMTNLFDGASFIVQKNTGGAETGSISEEQVRGLIAEALRDFAKSLGGE